MAAESREIRDLVFVEHGVGEDGSIFKFSSMNYEFPYLSKMMRNCWYKDERYPVDTNTSIELTHTVAKVFVVNTLMPVGYVVLQDVKESSTPTPLYYFTMNKEGKYVSTPLEQNKDYVFYFEDKIYNLATAEAKKEEQEPEDDENKKKKSFLKNKNFGSSFLSSFSSTPEVGGPISKSQQKKGKRLFNFKSGSSLFSAASNSDIEDVSLSPEKGRASPVSPKIECPIEIERASSASPKIESPLDIERASSASPKINKSIHFGK